MTIPQSRKLEALPERRLARGPWPAVAAAVLAGLGGAFAAPWLAVALGGLAAILAHTPLNAIAAVLTPAFAVGLANLWLAPTAFIAVLWFGLGWRDAGWGLATLVVAGVMMLACGAWFVIAMHFVATAAAPAGGASRVAPALLGFLVLPAVFGWVQVMLAHMLARIPMRPLHYLTAPLTGFAALWGSAWLGLALKPWQAGGPLPPAAGIAALVLISGYVAYGFSWWRPKL